jgi:hypothetical protein
MYVYSCAGSLRQGLVYEAPLAQEIALLNA